MSQPFPLDNGFGYWMKVTADGIIVFNSTPVIDSCMSKGLVYQGKFCNTVAIGGQCWMAENLDVGVMIAAWSTSAHSISIADSACAASRTDGRSERAPGWTLAGNGWTPESTGSSKRD